MFLVSFRIFKVEWWSGDRWRKGERRKICCSRKYSYPSHGRFFALDHPPLQPQGKFHFSFIVFIKNSGFRIYPPTLRMYNDLPWDVYGYFMELYNVQFLAPLVIYCVKFLIREGGVMQGLGWATNQNFDWANQTYPQVM